MTRLAIVNKHKCNSFLICNAHKIHQETKSSGILLSKKAGKETGKKERV